MNITRILAIAYALVITSIGLNAALPESIPLTPAALRAYVNNMPGKQGNLQVWGTLVADGKESSKDFDITETGAEGILKAIADANVDFGVVDPAQKVGLGIWIYDNDWNELYYYSARKSVEVAKGGGYKLADPTFKLVLSEIWIDVGVEVGEAQLVFTNRFGGVDRIVTLDSDDGDTGFYLSESDLAAGGAYLRLYVGDDWEEYFYSPDGKFVVPEGGEVHSLVGSINGVIIIRDNWAEQTVYTYKGRGQNPTFEFHPTESGMYQLPIVTSEGFAPLTIYVMYPDGQVYEYPAVVGDKWNQIGLKGGAVYQIFVDWGGALVEDNGKG